MFLFFTQQLNRAVTKTISFLILETDPVVRLNILSLVGWLDNFSLLLWETQSSVNRSNIHSTQIIELFWTSSLVFQKEIFRYCRMYVQGFSICQLGSFLNLPTKVSQECRKQGVKGNSCLAKYVQYFRRAILREISLLKKVFQQT